jgi:hypothetical protein
MKSRLQEHFNVNVNPNERTEKNNSSIGATALLAMLFIQ